MPLEPYKFIHWKQFAPLLRDPRVQFAPGNASNATRTPGPRRRGGRSPYGSGEILDLINNSRARKKNIIGPRRHQSAFYRQQRHGLAPDLRQRAEHEAGTRALESLRRRSRKPFINIGNDSRHSTADGVAAGGGGRGAFGGEKKRAKHTQVIEYRALVG